MLFITYSLLLRLTKRENVSNFFIIGVLVGVSDRVLKDKKQQINCFAYSATKFSLYKIVLILLAILSFILIEKMTKRSIGNHIFIVLAYFVKLFVFFRHLDKSYRISESSI